MSRYAQQSSLGIIVAMLIIGLCLIGYGIADRNEKYEAPIYISKEFENVGSYSIKGKIANRTAKDVHTSITVCLSSGKQNNTVYTATYTKSNVIVPAHGEITIDESSLSIIGNKNVYYTSVSWVSCDINGNSYYLKYSKDGKSFNNTTGQIVWFTIGGILCGLAVIIIILRLIYSHKDNSF